MEGHGCWVIVEPSGSDHRGHSYTICVMKKGKLICAADISTEQYLHVQIRKTVRQLEDRKTLITESKRPFQQLVHNCRLKAMQEPLNVPKVKSRNKESTPLHDGIWDPIVSTTWVVPLLSTRVAWLSLNVKEGQAIIPVLLGQLSLPLQV